MSYSDGNFAVCLAAEGFLDVLLEELRRHHVRVLERRDKLVLTEPLGAYRPAWAQNI